MSRRFTFPVVVFLAAALAACNGPAGSGEPAATGTHRWTQQFGTASLEVVTAIATGPEGLVVVGQTGGDLGGPQAGSGDVFVQAFDAEGQVTWTRQVGSSEADMAHGVGIDAAGIITVVGHTWGDLFEANHGGRDAFVWRLTSSGADVSVEQFSASGIDVARAVAVAPSGAFVVVGMTSGVFDGVNAGGRDAFVRWYDDDGDLVRTRQFGSTEDDGAEAVALDDDGTAYVLGFTEGALDAPHAGESDVFLRAFDMDGELAWGRQFGTTAFDVPEDVASDGSGTVFLVGHTAGALDGPLTGTVDAFVRSYDAAGTLRWAQQFGAPPGTATVGVAIDTWRNVLIAGSTTGALEGVSSGGSDVFVRKLDADGHERWTRQVGSGADDFAEALAISADGTVFVAGITEGDFGASHAGEWDVFVLAFSP